MQNVLPGLDEPGSLADLISRFNRSPKAPAFDCSAGLAKSILQKSVRRGEHDVALRAAATLLAEAPDQLWRRLAGIAMEDVGHGSWSTVEAVTRLAHSKRERDRYGDPWKVAAFAVDALCSAPKCRASDDLLMSSQRHPALNLFRSRAKEWTDGSRLEFVVGDGPIMERAAVAWIFLQAESTPPYWSVSRERADRLLGVLFDSGIPAKIIDTADRSFRVTSELLPFMACLLAPTVPRTMKAIDDPVTATAEIGGVPNWALDLFCPEGRVALQHFLTFDCASARTIRTTVPAGRQLGVLGHLLFRIEGQQCRHRRRWKLAADLQHIMDEQCHAPYFPNARQILNALREDLPLINLARHEVSHG